MGEHEDLEELRIAADCSRGRVYHKDGKECRGHLAVPPFDFFLNPLLRGRSSPQGSSKLGSTPAQNDPDESHERTGRIHQGDQGRTQYGPDCLEERPVHQRGPGDEYGREGQS